MTLLATEAFFTDEVSHAWLMTPTESTGPKPPVGSRLVIDRERLGDILAVLADQGYRVVGPTVRDQAIVYAELEGIDDLPWGITDTQEGGRYRLLPREDDAAFGYAVGPQSWKRFLHPPQLTLVRARREGAQLRFEAEAGERPRYAFLGVRACELEAIAVQDRVFLQGPFADPDYRERRERAFMVAVNCMEAGGTCFCVSMDTGPAVRRGFDLALTELLDAEAEPPRHEFLLEVGSESGAAVAAELDVRAAQPADEEAARGVVARTARQMGREIDTRDLPGLLARNLEHPRWDEVAGRCLTCTNCTMVCPTCFCTSVEDTSDLAGDLAGESAARVRRWDSCYTMDFSYVHGGSVRTSTRARYRQWMTHKLGTWHDQFGTSGCVGCGRCITWCPVGIDITEEAAAIRATDGARKAADAEKKHGDS